jgi:hypothetical protein
MSERLLVAFALSLLAGCSWFQGEAACTDGRVNGRETEVDCGGDCAGCQPGQLCLNDIDCESLVCTLNRCAAATCADGVENGDETDIDCGGTCRPCTATAATCADGQLNGDETDIDCGGTCPGCPDGLQCQTITDCVSELCADGRCGAPSQCGAPLQACGGACVDVMRDTRHCGQCGRGCGVGERCQSGQCVLSCGGGGGLTCGSACVDPGSNRFHCGRCDRTCAPDDSCIAGLCVMQCLGGQQSCNGTCVSVDRDPANCGVCGRVCGPTELCVGGQCGVACAQPLTTCGGACVDPRNDPLHCGGCGQPCPPLENSVPACSNSNCILGECSPGFDNCNALPTDGCEADLGFSQSNCGVCGRACAPGAMCVAGQCCGPIPPGPYQATCMGCQACNGFLACVCRDVTQAPRPTAIPLGCPLSYNNCDGVLTCGTCP